MYCNNHDDTARKKVSAYFCKSPVRGNLSNWHWYKRNLGDRGWNMDACTPLGAPEFSETDAMCQC